MQIIQSFWTGNSSDLSKRYGWGSPIYNYLSWTLSCNQLRKYYDDVTLITDESGYDILIKKLHLPYTNVIVALDELNRYNPYLWALGKIKSYSMMTEPFIHVDGDVFIWSNLEKEVTKKNIFVQNKEWATNYYLSMWENIKPQLSYIPECLIDFDSGKEFGSYNMGIFGGNDLEFIREYSQEAFYFVDKNYDNIKDLSTNNLNIFFEQILLFGLAKKYNKDIGTYMRKEFMDNDYSGLADFDGVPDRSNYIHLIGPYKKNDLICNKLNSYVLRFYPEYYERIEDLFQMYPKYGECHSDYSETAIRAEEARYMYGLIEGGNAGSLDKRSLYLRDMISYDSIKLLDNSLRNNETFRLILASGIQFCSDKILINYNMGNPLSIPRLSVDSIILELLNKELTRTYVEKEIIKYVSIYESDKTQARFFNLLWKRLTTLVSNGVLFCYRKE